MSRIAHRTGDSLCGIRGLGGLVFTSTAHVNGGNRAVFRRGRMVDIHPSLARSELATPEVAVMPRAVIDGDHVRLTGVRNFDYRGRNDFTVRYEDREVLLSHLKGLDFYISYFTEGPIGHTFLSFTFDNAPPLCISIETRPEIGEGFAPIASL